MDLKEVIEIITDIITSVVGITGTYILLTDRKKQKPTKSNRRKRKRK